MTHVVASVTALCATALLAACAVNPSAGPRAQAKLEARSGSTVAGTVTLTQVANKVQIEASLTGLTPGEHGFHVHEVGDCSAADASSAKGHFNPAGKGHGHHHGPERHAGDLPNLVADAAGRATYRAEVDMLTLDKGPMGIVGRSLVVHADPDDYRSQPAGNSGKRVACGVIAGV